VKSIWAKRRSRKKEEEISKSLKDINLHLAIIWMEAQVYKRLNLMKILRSLKLKEREEEILF